MEGCFSKLTETIRKVGAVNYEFSESNQSSVLVLFPSPYLFLGLIITGFEFGE